MPLNIKALYWLAHLLVMLLYAYLSFLALQITLFNLILLGLIFICGGKVNKWLSKYRFKQEYNFQHSHLNKFITKANAEYFTDLNVKVVAGDEGRWLEFHLPEDAFPDLIQRNSPDFMNRTAITEQSDEDDDGSQAPIERIQ